MTMIPAESVVDSALGDLRDPLTRVTRPREVSTTDPHAQRCPHCDDPVNTAILFLLHNSREAERAPITRCTLQAAVTQI